MKNRIIKSCILRHSGVVVLSCLLLTIAGCMKNVIDLEQKFIREGDIPGLPSASGIEKAGDVFYIVGDDAPWLFRLNNEMVITDRIRMAPDAEMVGGRIIKKEKRDYEALAFANWGGKQYLLAFGSGSLEKKRDFMFAWSADKQGKEYDLHSLYKYLREILHERGAEMNIEAAAFWNSRILLFNRGGNIVFSFDSYQLYRYLEGRGILPEPEVRQFKLPGINGIEAGFSGAQLLVGTDLVIFTATIEDTKDWYQDGEILGSFIGVLDLTDPKTKEPTCRQVMKSDKPYPGKLESVVVKEQHDDRLNVVAVRDNDDGTSSFVEIELYLKK